MIEREKDREIAGDQAERARALPSNGVVLIDGKTATSINFQRAGEADALTYDISFRLSSKVVHKEKGLTAEQLDAAVGHANAERIKHEPEAKGSLKGEALTFNAGLSSDELASRVTQAQELLAGQLRGDALERAARQRARDQTALGRLEEANTIIDARTRERESGPSIPSGSALAAGVSTSRTAAPGEMEPTGAVAVESDQLALRIRESLSKRYLEGDNAYHYRNGKTSDDVAFSYTGSTIVTQANGGDVVRDMVALSVARGWTEVRVTGSEAFKREAWLEASLYGLKVDGYKPRDVDMVRLDELRADEAKRMAAVPEANANAIHRGEAQNERAVHELPNAGRSKVIGGLDEEDKTQSRVADTVVVRELRHIMKERGDSDAAIAMATAIAAERLDRHHQAIVGTVKDHGSARYQHIPDERQSYFVTLETRAGQKTIWGVDLERAVADAKVGPGQLVALEPLGRKAVDVEEIVRDENGTKIGSQNISAHRNHWQVVPLDQLDKRERAELSAIASRQGTVPNVPDRHRDESHHVRTREVHRVDLER